MTERVDQQGTAASVYCETVAQGRVHLARRVLLAFILTFIAARVLVFLILSRRVPDLFLHVGGTHVHGGGRGRRWRGWIAWHRREGLRRWSLGGVCVVQAAR